MYSKVCPIPGSPELPEMGRNCDRMGGAARIFDITYLPSVCI